MSALPGTTGRRRIYLMRHGHVDYFGREIQAAGGDSKVVPLTPLGEEQARAGARALPCQFRPGGLLRLSPHPRHSGTGAGRAGRRAKGA